MNTIANVQATEKQKAAKVAGLYVKEGQQSAKSQGVSAPENVIDRTAAAAVSQGEKKNDAGTYDRRFDEVLDDKKNEAKNDVEKEEESSLSDSTGRMTEEDYEALEEEGISLESYEAGRLERALLRMKENKEFRAENIERRAENKEEMEETIKKMAISLKISDPMAKKLAYSLMEADLPITAETMSALASAAGMIDAVGQLSDGGKAYMIDNELEPTVENFYHSQYSGSMTRYNEAGFEEVRKQVEEIIKKAGLEVNEETMAEAKWLYANELPITETSLNALASIREITENADDDFILRKMAEAMAKGQKPEKVNLDTGKEKVVENARRDYDDMYHSLQNNVDIEAITARRQLEEIRLKLTAEAGLKLLSKGIALDTSNLQRVVDGLKQVEREYYQGMFHEASVKNPSAKQLEMLQNTLETVDSLKDAPSYIIGATLRQRDIMTLGNLHEAATNMKLQMAKAGQLYETMRTQPRADLGDSIKKAFRDVPKILEELHIEDTQENERAVRILSYNQMEINKESIEAVKAYDVKVNNLLDGLKPAVTVELIKRDINPLDVQMDNLNSELKSIDNDMGITPEEKYSKFLWKLEHTKGISEDERSSYIGIYRLLNNIEKSDGAIIGTVLNNGMRLTLSNLLTAMRSRKVAGMDFGVDESFGLLEDLKFKNARISDQIAAGFDEDSNMLLFGDSEESGVTKEAIEYYQNVVSKIIDEVTPEKLERLASDGLDGLMDMTLEKLEDNLEQAVEDKRVEKAYIKQQTEKIREVAKKSDEPTRFLEQFEVDATLKNLVACETFYGSGKSYFKDFQKYADKEYDDMIEEFSDAIEDSETLQAKFDQVEAKVNQILEKEYGKPAKEESSARVDELRIFANGIALAKRLSRQECYQIPIRTGDQITTINLTLRKGHLESGKVQISMDSESYGKLDAEFSVNGDTLRGFVLCDTRNGFRSMNAATGRMKQDFEAIGLNVQQINVGFDSVVFDQSTALDSTKDINPSTQKLYQIAKVAVTTIRREILKK